MADLEHFDPVAILATFAEHDVDLVVIGGFAGIVHGSDHFTVDVDVTPSRDPANLDRLSDALRALDARIRVDGIDGGLPFDHTGESLARAGIWNLETPMGDLDLSFVPGGTEGYDDLRRSAVVVDLGRGPVVVASLDDIIRSKEAADRPKDRLTLPSLRYLRDHPR